MGGESLDRVRSVAELIERTRQMPLEKMRFFINEDRREPKCFGIYHDDALDRWIVYKNKADGSRAVRYSGPDEGYAAQEIWAKIQSEIELRRPKQMTPAQKRAKARGRIIAIVAAIALAAGMTAFVIHEFRKPNRGYYRVDDGLYYYQNSDWYYYDDGDWTYYDAPEDEGWYGDGYYGQSYYGFEDEGEAFEYSEYYVEPARDDSSDSSDDSDAFDSDIFDSWDSDATDWDSDW